MIAEAIEQGDVGLGIWWVIGGLVLIVLACLMIGDDE